MNISTRYNITPLRSSTIKTTESQPTIQSHFTYITRNKRQSNKQFVEKEQETYESLCPSERYLSSPSPSTLSIDSDLSGSSSSSATDFYLLPRLGTNSNKRVLVTCEKDNEYDAENVRKVPRTVVPSMGTRIQLHPRYKKTRYQSSISPFSDEQSSVVELGPVCSMPLPNMFMYAPLPVTIQKPNAVNCETQTSPDPTKTPVIANRRSGSRRSSGANMLAGIKTAFGSIRRAISADRLDQISTPNNTKTTTPQEISNETPKLRQRVLMSPKKFVLSATSGRNSSTFANIFSTPIPVVTEESLSEVNNDKLTCEVIKSYQDGSKHIQLERTSLKTPFGFYISKDEYGIYVSKLGTTTKRSNLNGLIKVGDRLKFIQGIDGFTADVASIKAMVKEDLRLDLIIKTPTRRF